MDTNQPISNSTTQPESSVTTPNEPITQAIKKFKINPKLLYGTLAASLLLAVGAFYYAYSQGNYSGAATTSTSSPTSTPTPTVSSDISSLDSTASEVQADLNDVDGINSDINSIDATNDQTPQL